MSIGSLLIPLPIYVTFVSILRGNPSSRSFKLLLSYLPQYSFSHKFLQIVQHIREGSLQELVVEGDFLLLACPK